MKQTNYSKTVWLNEQDDQGEEKIKEKTRSISEIVKTLRWHIVNTEILDTVYHLKP